VNKALAPTENDIIKLLTNMGTVNQPYPSDLLEARRSAYLTEVTALVGSGLHSLNGGGKGGISASSSAPMTSLMKAVLTILVAGNIALATYLGIVIYQNWDKVQELLFSAPAVSELTPVPLDEPIQAPDFIVSPESTDAPDATLEPNGSPEEAVQSEGDVVDSPLESTPEPEDKPGLRLGQTPHGPDAPPGGNNQDTSEDNSQNNQDKNKNK